MAGGSALGQRLNLQSSGAPAAGSGAATLALADVLDRQIDGLRKQGGAGPSVRVSIALRAAARDLLRSGEATGEAGSSKVVLGRTIADHLALLEARATDPAKMDAGVQEAMARDLESLPAGGDIGTIERRLRDALAPVTQAIDGPPVIAGWFAPGERPGETPEPLVRWSTALEIGDPLRNAIAAVDERLRSAVDWAAYRPAATRAAALVRAAAGPLEKRMAWMTPQARRDLEDQLVEALGALTAEPTPGEPPRDSSAPLRRLAVISRLLQRTGELDDNAAGVRELRAALMGAIRTAAPSNSEERRLAMLERALILAERRRELERGPALSRQLNVGRFLLAPAARDSEAAMLTAVRRLLTDEASATDPAVLNSVSAHQRRVDDLALVVDVNRLITTPTGATAEKSAPAVAAEYRGLSEWMFSIGQDLGKPARRDVAIAELRDVAGGAIAALDSGALRRLREVVDPSLPRSPGPSLDVWNELTGGRAVALVDAADKARAGLIAAWAAKDVPRRQDAERRARQINRVLEVIDDTAWSRTLAQAQLSGVATPTTANLHQWPGWQLSTGALQALGDGLASACRTTVDRLMAGDAGGTESAVRGIESRFAVVQLAGRLERLATRAGFGSTRAGTGPSLLEIGLGPPDPERSWMAPDRDSLAAVCRYAEEWAAAAGDSRQADRAAALKAYVEGLAARAVERIRAAG